MWILGLEAGAALLLLVFIVWWTMFAGRPKESAAPATRPAAPDERAPGDRPGPGPGTGT